MKGKFYDKITDLLVDDGNTEAMAELVAEGAKADGAEVTLAEVSEMSAEEAAQFDKLALGCPANGDEDLEEGEFAPFYEALKDLYSKEKPLALFGSYGWGDGEWMRNWQKDAEDAGLQLIADGLICLESPEDSGLEDECRKLGKALADAS